MKRMQLPMRLQANIVANTFALYSNRQITNNYI